MAPSKHPSHSHHAHKDPPHVVSFIALTALAAKKVTASWGVPASVLIAQSAQETGWGRRVVNNAYFGIKGKSPDGSTVNFATTEVINGQITHITDSFRAYTSFADAADDYGRFLSTNPRYATAFHFKNDPEKFVQEMAKAGYATDPNYAKSIISIIHSHHLAQYDK